MKKSIFLGLLIIGTNLMAAGLPQTTLTFELEQETKQMDLLVNLLEQNLESSLVIYADLNSDNEKEEYMVKPKKKPRCEPNLDNDCDGLTITIQDSSSTSNIEQKMISGIRDPQSGLPTGKRGHLYINQSQVEVAGSNIAILFEKLEEKLIIRKGWDGTVKGKFQKIESSKQLFNIVFYDVDSSFNSFLRKGWDGTVKGLTKKQEITVIVKSLDGSQLGMFIFKTKDEAGKIQSCSGSVCGKTDHF